MNKSTKKDVDISSMNRCSNLQNGILKTNQDYDDFNKLFSGHLINDMSIEQALVSSNISPGENRDVVATRNIAKVLQEGKKLVHVCGIIHSLRDSRKLTVYSLLESYKPTRSTIGYPKYS